VRLPTLRWRNGEVV